MCCSWKLIPRLWKRKKSGRNDWEGRKRRKRRKERKEGQNKHGMEEGQLIEEESRRWAGFRAGESSKNINKMCVEIL